jgi:glucose-1-phosphate thymidylyltransferase
MSQASVPKEGIVGVIPAGGQATRISPLPCSKELYPIGFHTLKTAEGVRPKVSVQYLLEKMRGAGISNVYMVLAPGKWDIPAYFRDGSMVNMHIGYLMLGPPFGVPFTLDQAYPFVQRQKVAFGFPDILFDSEDGFRTLLQRQTLSGCDIALGLSPATHPLSGEDRVVCDDSGRVKKIVLKPSESDLPNGWVTAVWNHNFTEFLHGYVRDNLSRMDRIPELSAGHAIEAAIQAGLRVEAVMVTDKPYLDIGTPEGLQKALAGNIERKD